MKTESSGALILSAGGATLFAAGLACRPEVADALAAVPRKPVRGLFTLEVAQEAYSVVGTGSAEAVAYLLFEAGAGDVLFDFAATVDSAADILRHLLTNPYEALAVVDREGLVRFLSPIHERFFGLQRGEAVGRHVTEVIENTRLHEVVRSGKAEIGQVQQMRGTARVVSRIPVLDAEGRVVAAIGQIMFKGPDQLRKLNAELARLKSEITYYQRALSSRTGSRHGLDRIIGQSKAIRRLKEQVSRIAPLNVPVLLVGESGTGKELVAHAVHLLSQRRDESLVMVNAAALPATLVESELFGYEPGAFTGAERKGRRGKFEQAHHGTLFFDEVGDMPVDIQVKLLRVLQDGSFERVGGDKPRVSDFRLVCASNRDFQSMIDKGEFRLDLFYRISAVTLHLPPLRERLEDIELLANQALYDFAVRHTTRQKTLAPDVVAFLQGQNWPGNVRQLMHAVEAAAIFSDRDVVTVDDFQAMGRPMEPRGGRPAAAEQLAPVPTYQPQPAPLAAVRADLLPLSAPEQVAPHPAAPEAAEPAAPVSQSVRETLGSLEEKLIREAMLQYGGNKKRVARELGISRTYLYKKLGLMGYESPAADDE